MSDENNENEDGPLVSFKPERTTNPNNKYYTNAEDAKAMAADMSIVDAEKKLTNFQRSLVHNIVHRGMQRADAVKAAGSSVEDKTARQRLAYETLNKPHVRAYYDYQVEKKNAIAGVDKVEVIEGLRQTIEAAMADGKYKDVLKGYELLGASLGMWKSVSQSTTIKKTDDKKSSLLEDASEDETEDAKAARDIQKLLGILGNNNKK